MAVKASGADGAGSPRDAGVLVEVTQLHMGMPVRLRVYSPDPDTGRRACRAAFERVAELNMILSDYEHDSELSRLVRRAGEGPVPVSAELFRVLAAAGVLASRTEGLLDPTAAPVVRLWREARTERRLPDPGLMRSTLRHVGYRHLRLDEGAHTAELVRPGMRLDLGAIAKGYVGDEALRVLRQRGLPRAMFEAGGDMVFGDPPPGEDGWLVRPEVDGLPELRLTNCAAAVSGNTIQFVVIGGERYGHIIDPRSGEPIRTRRVCLVTAPTGLTADPLATLGTMMEPEPFRALLENWYPGVDAWVVSRAGAEPGLHAEQQP